MTLSFEVDLSIEDIVYLKTDIDQKPRIVVSFLIDNSGTPMYGVMQETYKSFHYGIELSTEKDILMSSSN